MMPVFPGFWVRHLRRGTGRTGTFCVIAVDVPELEVDENTSPAVVNFKLFFHGIARAFLTVTYEEN